MPAKWLSPIGCAAAVELAEWLADELATDILRSSPRDANGHPSVQPPKLGRPTTDMFDVLVCGFVMGMTGLSARRVSAVVKPPAVTATVDNRTISRRLVRDLLPLLHQAARLSAGLAARATSSPDVIVIDWSGDVFAQAIGHVGIGRARRKDDRGLLADALQRVTGVNLKIIAAHGAGR